MGAHIDLGRLIGKGVVWVTYWSMLIGFAVLIMNTVAVGQSVQCKDHESIVAYLKEKHGEELQSLGLAQKGNLMQIWANPKTGTFTVVFTQPRGIACIMAYGNSFTFFEESER